MTTPSSQSIPYGFCHCGCGRKTALAKNTIPRLKIVKGLPNRWIFGHCSKKPGPDYVIEDRGYETACWIWQRATDDEGYGKTRRNGVRRAHRAFYEERFGALAPGLVPDHLCRVRNCVNPDHMEPVTNKENNRRGSNSKLSMESAEIIRSLQGTRPQKQIAAEFGVSCTTVCNVMNRRIWD